MTDQTGLMYINIKFSGIYTPYDYAENLVIGRTDAAYRKTILTIRLPSENNTGHEVVQPVRLCIM